MPPDLPSHPPTRIVPRAFTVLVITVGMLLATAHAAGASHRHRPAPARPFVAHGMVVGHTANAITVLAHDARSGRSVARNTALNVTVATGTRGRGAALKRVMARMAAGDAVTLVGSATGSQVVVTQIADRPAPFHVYLGTVTAVSGSTLTVAKAATSSDDAEEGDQGSFTVDASTAAITVDGAPSDVTGLAVGQGVALLGSQASDVVVATSVWAFAVPPAVVAGEVSDVTGSVVTVDGENDTTTAVDLTGVPVVLDGVSNATPDQITQGARVVVLGSTDATTGAFTPTMAFAFTHACDSHHHGDGGQDQQSGDGSGSGSGSGSGD